LRKEPGAYPKNQGGEEGLGRVPGVPGGDGTRESRRAEQSLTNPLELGRQHSVRVAREEDKNGTGFVPGGGTLRQSSTLTSAQAGIALWGGIGGKSVT